MLTATQQERLILKGLCSVGEKFLEKFILMLLLIKILTFCSSQTSSRPLKMNSQRKYLGIN